MAALVVAFWLGVWATHTNFVKPAQEAEAKLRKELGEARVELEKERDFSLQWLSAGAMFDLGRVAVAKHSVSHLDLTEPKIERREHSDVFKIASIDALIEGTK